MAVRKGSVAINAQRLSKVVPIPVRHKSIFVGGVSDKVDKQTQDVIR